MKFGIFLIGIALILQSLLLLLGIDMYGAKSSTIKASWENGLTFLGLGIFILILSKYAKQEKYSICQKCKETFNYNELENGKCKYCDDIDTIDIEEYYKNNSNKKRI